jgi:hypothetical protein
LESEQQTEFLKVIKLFHDNDCLNHVVVIGSWKEEKREKDRDGILALFPHIDKTKYANLLEGCTKKEKAKVGAFWATAK